MYAALMIKFQGTFCPRALAIRLSVKEDELQPPSLHVNICIARFNADMHIESTANDYDITSARME